jgi:uncharacterized membrane-anchored protein
MTIQAQIKTTLAKAGIPAREIEVYGRQIVITSACQDTARDWAALLAKFATVRGIVETVDEAKDQSHRTTIRPKYVKVWRTFAAMA